MMWWMWIVLGFVLLVAEVAIPGGIILLFFGAAALLVGALVGIGAGGPPWLQALLFSVISVISLLTLRGPILRRMGPLGRPDPIDSLVGRSVEALEDLPAGGEGKVELRGTSWTAQNVGGEAVAAGQKCVVQRLDGLKLYVRSQ